MSELWIWVGGAPATQGSKSQTRTGRMYEADKKLPAWRKAIIEAADAAIDSRGAEGLTYETIGAGPIEVEITFYLIAPKTVPTERLGMPCVKPDIDKLSRAVLDALTINGRVWKDDAQVTDIIARKRYLTAEDLNDPAAPIEGAASIIVTSINAIDVAYDVY